MIAGFFPTAYFAFDACGREYLRRGRVQQKVIDADAGIASVCVAEIIPERVDGVCWIECSECVSPALGKEFLIGGARLGKEERVFNPALRLVGVQLLRDDVVVASKNDWPIAVDEALRVNREALKPFKFVVEFGAGSGIAVGKVQTADQNAVDICFDIAAVGIVGIS